MKLYYLPGACSLVPHIVLRELGLDFELMKVGRDKRTADGEDFLQVNPFGYVPALKLATGEVLTEVPAIAQYLADLKPEAQLAPANGTMDRYRLQSMLGLVNSEIHKSIGALFKPGLDEAGVAAAKERIDTRLGPLETLIGDRTWLVGDRFTVADAYLYVVTGWLRLFDIDIARWPRIAAHHERVAHRPAVQAARQAEKGAGKNA
jgi:glutathione S-transferase